MVKLNILIKVPLAVTLILLFSWSAWGDEAVKGKIKSIAGPAKTISLAVENRGAMIFKWTDTTKFGNAKDSKELHPEEAVMVEYVDAGSEHIATKITRILAKLPKGVTEIKTAELEALARKGPGVGGYTLIDARPASKYGEGHIPTAVSIPFSELEKQGAKLLPAEKDRLLIFYCGGVTCVLSPKSAALAQSMGYSNVRVYVDGEPAWKKSELLLESTPEFVKTGNAVIVDVREPEAVQKGHIPGAVNIPLAKMGGAEKRFPSYKGVPVVFYGENGVDVAKALEYMHDWGYRNVTMLAGNLEGWRARGFGLGKGAGVPEIRYTQVCGPNEVSIAAFEKARTDGSAVIVDVRTPEEFSRGHFPGAINIPVEELAAKQGTLPKERVLMFHCSTGARAEMAFDVLNGKGYRVKYLKANVEFASNGKARIME